MREFIGMRGMSRFFVLDVEEGAVATEGGGGGRKSGEERNEWVWQGYDDQQILEEGWMDIFENVCPGLIGTLRTLSCSFQNRC